MARYQVRRSGSRKPDVRIEFPSTGATYFKHDYGVYQYDVYPRHSVLAGQTRRTFLDSFATEAEAKTAYPEAMRVVGSGYAPPSLNHLPDDGDY